MKDDTFRVFRAAMLMVVCVSTLGLVYGAHREQSPPSRLEVVSPDGKHRVVIEATDAGASIVVSGDASGRQATINSTALGMYGPRGKDSRPALAAGLTADDKGGYLQLYDAESRSLKLIGGKSDPTNPGQTPRIFMRAP
jgi:hypothetical protein